MEIPLHEMHNHVMGWISTECKFRPDLSIDTIHREGFRQSNAREVILQDFL